MKSGEQVERRGAFSLLELMVVIAVIAILAGLVLFALPPILLQLKRDQTELFLKELNSGLAAYHQDNGMYPLNAKDEELGAFVLYQHLSGDFDGDGKLDPVSAGSRIYVTGIDWESARSRKAQSVALKNGRYLLVDSFGSPIRYLSEPPGVKTHTTHNPTYDLWSLGGAKPGSAATADVAKWITNW